MTPKNVLQADQEILDIIGKAIIDDTGLTLTGQLDRDQYVAVNKFLELAGAKWNKRAKRHLFEPGAKKKIEGLLADGEILDAKKSFQAFYTPSEIAKELVSLADIQPGMRCLEPSAGDGAIAGALKEVGAEVVCVEVDPDAVKKLQAKGFEPLVQDFLTIEPELFDRVVMNPPFTGDQDIAHVLHAFKFLTTGGKLIAIMGPGFTFGETKKRTRFREFLAERGWIVKELPEGTFKDSGTMIRTVVIELLN